MRIKRTEKFRKIRRARTFNFFLLGIMLPCTTILIGYLISSLIILPAIQK